jgi:beta-glucanase (GH16 family)
MSFVSTLFAASILRSLPQIVLAALAFGQLASALRHADDTTSYLQTRVEAAATETEKAHHSSEVRFKSFCEEDGFVSEWADEFSGQELDRSVWQVIDGQGRTAGPQTSVVAGLEVTACRTAECRTDNVQVKNGKLYLLSERDASNSSQFFTGAITTKGRKVWGDSPAYRMCISAQLPGRQGPLGKGVWPAHWMLPDNGISDSCLDEGEMDIMEMVNSDGGAYSTFHWMTSWPEKKCADFDTYHKSTHALTRMPDDWNLAFHEYAVERSGEHLAFAVDGQVTLNVSARDANTELSHTPFFLILNTAIGGGWPGEPTSSTHLPVEHVIDYVRVSRRKEARAHSTRGGPSRTAETNVEDAAATPMLAQVSSEVHRSRSSSPPPMSLARPWSQ